MKAPIASLLLLAACGSQSRRETVALDPEMPRNSVSDTRPPASTSAPAELTATMLLDEAQIRGITGFQGTFAVGYYAEEDPGAGVTTRNYDGMDESRWEDAGLRLWHLSTPAALDEHLALLEKEFTTVKRTGDTSFVARLQGIQAVAVVDRPRQLVFLLTCGIDLCTNPDMSIRLADSISRRIEELWP